MKIVPENIQYLERAIEQIGEAIEQIREELKQNGEEITDVIRRQKLEEFGKHKDKERQLIEALDQAKKEWNEESDEFGIHNVNRLCLRIRNGKIEVLFQQESGGTYIYSDGRVQLENELILLTKSKWKNIIQRLEELVNRPDLKEKELQEFFEEYPDLIMEDDYSEIIPQATIVSEEGIKWKADFVLKPKNQTNFCKILELKLPKEKTFNKKGSGHRKYTSKLMNAVNQLKDYSEAFNLERTRQIFSNKYGTEVFKPDLHLMFGRKPNTEMIRDFLEMKRRTNINIEDWDTIIARLRRKFGK